MILRVASAALFYSPFEENFAPSFFKLFNKILKLFTFFKNYDIIIIENEKGK